MGRIAELQQRLAGGRPVLLDGPVGTELTRRGVDTGLPLWSARALLTAPHEVAEIHRDYARSGAEVLTTNTFRTHRRSLARDGRGDRAEELTRLAVGLARSVLAESSGWVAGSVSPLEDCYSPELTPPDAALHGEHAEMCGWLADAGVDLLLVETMPTVREAVAAARAARDTGLPVLVCLACGGGGRLLSGEDPAEAARALEPLGPSAIGVNCTPTLDLARALARLAGGTSLPLVAYGNVGHAESEQGWVRTGALGPEDYLRHAREWRDLGARVIGSCCGTGPEHTRALAGWIAEGSVSGDREGP